MNSGNISLLLWIILGILPSTRQRQFPPRRDTNCWRRNVMHWKRNSEQSWLHFWRTKWKWTKKCKKHSSNSLMLIGLLDNSSKCLWRLDKFQEQRTKSKWKYFIENVSCFAAQMSKNQSSVHSLESICQLKTLLVSCCLIYLSANSKIQVSMQTTKRKFICFEID